MAIEVLECPKCWSRMPLIHQIQPPFDIVCTACRFTITARDPDRVAKAWNIESARVSSILRELCDCGRVARMIPPHGSTVNQPAIGCFPCSLICYGPDLETAIQYWNQHRRVHQRTEVSAIEIDEVLGMDFG